ncbi:hypothetical protein SCP_1700080 [Sparassis crispa]|uniref:Uncharacterized protein n=1 Tax=Sparassis crispa TaxID=139825 RepID=A0A401H5J1_9APHY|nr:hypothetical protein SCP_1700080 [Sparassis crispa]GBE89684.1 hypothetical protein SCP_1700080 [Sparassis crispa]
MAIKRNEKSLGINGIKSTPRLHMGITRLRSVKRRKTPYLSRYDLLPLLVCVPLWEIEPVGLHVGRRLLGSELSERSYRKQSRLCLQVRPWGGYHREEG